jgi:hypothetical protein
MIVFFTAGSTLWNPEVAEKGSDYVNLSMDRLGQVARSRIETCQGTALRSMRLTTW